MIVDGTLCACGKYGYCKRTVETKRNVFIKNGRARHMRIYQCDKSDMWHLTNGDRAYEQKHKRGGYIL